MRPEVNGAHAYLGAPYGVYRTEDGWLALAMTPSLERLATLTGIAGLEPYYTDRSAAMRARAESFSVSLFNWPQAAKISRPRGVRTGLA